MHERVVFGLLMRVQSGCSGHSASWRPIGLDGVSAPYPPRVFYWHPDGASAWIYRVVVAATIHAAGLFSSSAFTINAQQSRRKRESAVATAAILFASTHIPNPVLMLATLLWGIAACTLFLRYRDLYSLGVAHCLLGICIAVTVPAHIHHGMRVGLGYLQYRPRVQRTHFSEMDQMVSTEAWVIADAVNRCSARQARP